MFELTEIPETITQDELFTYVRQEDIFEKYLGITPELNYKKFTNPLRKDKKADCTFGWHDGMLWFRDFPKGLSWNCITLVMETEHLNYYQAIARIAFDFRIKKDSRPKHLASSTSTKVKSSKKLEVKVQGWQSEDVVFWGVYHINSDTLKRFKVYSIKYVWLNGQLIYSYNSKDPCIGYWCGSGKWKLYFYKREHSRFIGNISKDHIQGYDELDPTGDILIITKSMKDIILLKQFGINSIAPHGEGYMLNSDLINELQSRFKKIFLLYDNDPAGIEASNKMHDLYPILTQIYIPANISKDITDFSKIFGEDQAKQLIIKLTQ